MLSQLKLSLSSQGRFLSTHKALLVLFLNKGRKMLWEEFLNQFLLECHAIQIRNFLFAKNLCLPVPGLELLGLRALSFYPL